ncbi:hypothetical protein WMY93_032775 [Mugilogobius chulae]|uniref:Uncharacterized protein n=1 Tax=Mugilogobius chulae TaxID=88201 RepID=A0AAW0MIQ9_9GOBI
MSRCKILLKYEVFFAELFLNSRNQERFQNILIYGSIDSLLEEAEFPYTSSRHASPDHNALGKLDGSFHALVVVGFATTTPDTKTLVRFWGPQFQTWLDSAQTLKRRKRFIEVELFHLEVLLAVDYSVLLFHGRENIQRYLLTFMNIVSPAEVKGHTEVMQRSHRS